MRISEQEMFVEEANQDTGLRVGDRILGLDGMSLEQVALQNQNYFISLTPERRSLALPSVANLPILGIVFLESD